jgi:hypothetical protein
MLAVLWPLVDIASFCGTPALIVFRVAERRERCLPIPNVHNS